MANVLKIKNNDTWETNISKIYKKVDNVWIEQDNNNWVNLFDLNFKYQRYSATPTAVLYSDGTLIFSDNEYICEGVHGDVIETYTGWDTEHYNKESVLPWFNQLKQITNVYINYINPRYTRNWFYGCTNLTSFNFNHFDTSNVISMENMFESCNSLTSLNLSGFNTSNVVSMDRMFSTCINLTSLDLSGFDTSNVTIMCRMFEHCRNLTSLDLSGFNTSKVTDMSTMFSDCINLTSIDLSSFDMSNVTNTNNMFYSLYNRFEGTIYVKNYATKTKIEASTNFPSTATVIIGKPN